MIIEITEKGVAQRFESVHAALAGMPRLTLKQTNELLQQLQPMLAGRLGDYHWAARPYGRRRCLLVASWGGQEWTPIPVQESPREAIRKLLTLAQYKEAPC